MFNNNTIIISKISIRILIKLITTMEQDIKMINMDKIMISRIISNKTTSKSLNLTTIISQWIITNTT